MEKSLLVKQSIEARENNMDTITLNMENLSEVERKQLLSLVEKANKPKRFCFENMRSEEIFFFIGSAGEVWEKDFVPGDPSDENRFLLGNAFPTREAAEFEVERLKVLHEIKEFIAKNDDGEINWANSSELKYILKYCIEDGKVFPGTFYTYVPYQKEVCASSKNVIDDMIETIGEGRIKKYYFGITE